MSAESLINVVFEKNIIQVSFSFGKCQQPVNREMTESCSHELIGY